MSILIIVKYKKILNKKLLIQPYRYIEKKKVITIELNKKK